MFIVKSISNGKCYNCKTKDEADELAKGILKTGKSVSIKEDRPEYGKVYSLTGGSNQPSISNGNSWKESLIV